MTYETLPAVVDVATAQNPGQAQLHAEAPNNTVYQWHLGDKAAADAAFASAKHVTKIDLVNNRLIPNAIEPRAAIGEYDSGNDSLTLYTTSQNPHVARLVLSAFIGLAPEHKLRVIAPDVGGGFGSKIFIYAEETVCLWASRKVGRPVKWTADRSESFLADAHGRDHATTAELAVDGDGKILALQGQDQGQPRRLSLDLCLLGADLSLRAAAVGPVQYPGHLLRGGRRLYHDRARRCLPRCRPARGHLRGGAPGRGDGAPDRPGPGRVQTPELHPLVPARHTGDHDL